MKKAKKNKAREECTLKRELKWTQEDAVPLASEAAPE
jgi:hypothetical protein